MSGFFYWLATGDLNGYFGVSDFQPTTTNPFSCFKDSNLQFLVLIKL